MPTIPPIPTPVPQAPPPPQRGTPSTKDVIRAAISRAPSRSGDQALYWGIRTLIEATKSLGFPVVVSFLLLWGGYQFGNKFIDANREAIRSQQELLKSNNDTAVTAIREMAQAQNESNEITRSLMLEVGMRPPTLRRSPRPTQPKAQVPPK